MLGAFWGAFDEALEKAGGLSRNNVRSAVECALPVYLFVPAGRAGERPCPTCVDGKLMLKFGRYGARFKHGSAYVGLSNDEDVLGVGFNRAVALADAKEGR